MVNAPASVAAGLLLDRAFGEPPPEVHPVALFGRTMQAFERVCYDDSRTAGVVYAAGGLALATTAAAVLRSRTAAVALSTAGRELRSVAARVRDALARDDLPAARALVPALVGRDARELGIEGLAAAVIESLAENTVDAVVAPAFWATAAGTRGVLSYRAINTLDAMVGHRSARYRNFGWASARLDDVANLVPARLTAMLVALVRPRAAAAITRTIRRDAPAHPSPNAGVAEAAFAAALGVELGGPLRYGDRLERRPRLGTGPRPGIDDINRAITLQSHVELAMVGALVAAAVAMRARP
jgi:adenosylcobinamide-phosphate synthase